MTWAQATILAGGIATLAIYSFLIKENPFYRTVEHLFIGIAAGLLPILTLKDFLWPNVLAPMVGANSVQFPDGTFSEPYNPWFLLYLVPLLFGMLYYALYIPGYEWLAKLVIGFSLGYSAGLAFKGFFAEMIPQLASSFKPLIVFRGSEVDLFESFNNSLFVFTLLAVMLYFFFSFRTKKFGVARVAAAGRWLMMVCFGAFFGSTIMARMALLVERLDFLTNSWLKTVIAVVTQ